MKKILFFIILLFSFNLSVNAERLTVTLDKCVDGDTAWFKLDKDIIKVRFLAINAPEYTSKIEKYGKESSDYVCKLLKDAKKIEIEYDPESDKTDKYDRHLVWVFVDDNLLQEKIVEKGLAKIDYIYDDYMYTDLLTKKEIKAKTNKIGIWEEYDNNFILPIIFILLVLLICLISTKFRNRILNNTTKMFEKNLIKEIKNDLKK